MPQSDKIKAFFCTFLPVWMEFASKHRKDTAALLSFSIEKGAQIY